MPDEDAADPMFIEPAPFPEKIGALPVSYLDSTGTAGGGILLSVNGQRWTLPFEMACQVTEMLIFACAATAAAMRASEKKQVAPDDLIGG